MSTMTTTVGAPSRRSRLLRAAVRTGSALTTPLLPDDYLALVNPLWSTRELRGRVEQVTPEAGGATSLRIRPGVGWTTHRAGQSVRVGVDLDGVRHFRSYSLTSPPLDGGDITITVKAVADGAVSRHLARRTLPGAVLRLGQPAGDFVLPARAAHPLLFVTAGSGVTPVMGMLRSLAREGALPDVVLVHSARDEADVLFGAELRRLARAYPTFRLVERHTAREGRMDVAALDALVPDWRRREAWVCGPATLLDVAEHTWQQAGLAGRLHTERFRPKLYDGPADAGGEVRFTRTERLVEADGAMALLDAGEAAGVLMPSGCRMGICHGCVVPLLAGRVRDLRTGAVHGEEGDLVQTCVSAAAGPVELDL
jgi:stearoyl-CoA 9-desaturase NADPH oxidoreductase